jgi:hypothetical protein
MEDRAGSTLLPLVDGYADQAPRVEIRDSLARIVRGHKGRATAIVSEHAGFVAD